VLESWNRSDGYLVCFTTNNRGSDDLEERPIRVSLTDILLTLVGIANSLLGEISSLHAMHSRPSSDLTLLPKPIPKLVTARVLKPTDPTTCHITLKHERAIGMADNEVHKAILGDVAGHDGDRAIELSDKVLGPCLTSGLAEIERHQWIADDLRWVTSALWYPLVPAASDAAWTAMGLSRNSISPETKPDLSVGDEWK
jgi:hypothetical protein